MKIFCIGRNYLDHAKELNNPVPTEPMVFMKPPTALLTAEQPFPYPNFSQNVHHEIELVLRISITGKNLSLAQADAAWDRIALGIDFTARDVQDRLKKAGQPWEIAKGFDGSAPLSDWVERSALTDESAIPFSLAIDGRTVQQGNSADLIFPFPLLISHLSTYFTLQPGDLIFTGTPAGVGPVHPGNELVGELAGRVRLHCRILAEG